MRIRGKGGFGYKGSCSESQIPFDGLFVCRRELAILTAY
jgi:hypothetical protein